MEPKHLCLLGPIGISPLRPQRPIPIGPELQPSVPVAHLRDAAVWVLGWEFFEKWIRPTAWSRMDAHWCALLSVVSSFSGRNKCHRILEKISVVFGRWRRKTDFSVSDGWGFGARLVSNSWLDPHSSRKELHSSFFTPQNFHSKRYPSYIIFPLKKSRFSKIKYNSVFLCSQAGSFGYACRNI